MSITGFNSDGTATINGLTTMSSNIMNSDELFYDSSTTPVNVKTAIDGITVDITAAEADIVVLQGQMSTAIGDINTLQSDMNTAQSDINTLQSDMNTAQSDINTLQSDMNTAQSDIIALGVSIGITAATVAGLVISQAAQDVTIAAQGVSIGVLQGEMNAVEADIVTLQVKTTDQSYGSLTGTSFSTKVNVGGGGGVVLNTGSASEFNSGITTDLVRSFNNNDLVLEGRGTGDAIMRTNGTDRVRCYDNGDINVIGTGATTVEGTGIAINATAAGIQTFATTSSLFQSTTTTTLTSGGETEINCVALDINATGATNLDTTGIAINATVAGIQTFATTSTLFQSTTTTTLTSGGTTEINSAGLDINASLPITIDTPETITLTSTLETEINCSTFDLNATGDVTITTTGGHIDIDAGAGKDVSITGCDQFKVTTETIAGVPAFQHISAVTTNDNMRLQSTGGYNMRIGEGSATTGIVILGVDSGTSSIDSNASSLTVRSDAVLTLRGDTSVTTTSTTNINATGSNATNIGNASSTTTQLGTININATGTSTTTIGATGTTTNVLGIATFAGTTTFNGNVLIQQTTYPPSSNSALGYTDSETTFTDPMSASFISRSNFSLPSKGVWLIVCGYEWGTNAANTVEQKKITLSTTSGGTTPAGYGLQYFEEINDSAGGAIPRQFGTIMGVVICTAATTIHVNASSSVASGTNAELRTNVSWTRIG